MSADLALGKQYLKSMEDLDPAVFQLVGVFQKKFMKNPGAAGNDLKSPAGVKDRKVKTARVSKYWRAVLYELRANARYILLAVKQHDDAYKYAEELKIRVNVVTGALELIDQAAIDEIIRSGSELPRTKQDGDTVPILRGITSNKLTQLGLSKEVADKAVAITDEIEFSTLCDALPESQGYVLLELQSGRSPDGLYQDLIENGELGEIDPDDLDAALDRPISQLEFAQPDHDELKAALDGTLESWRIWLHPLQQWAAYHDGWNGPFRLTGGAGTGKTVCAIHRSVYLAARLQDESDNPDHQILFATYTKNLAEELKRSLRTLGGDDITDTVDVFNLDALANQLLRHKGLFGRNHQVVTDNAAVIWATWDSAIAKVDIRDWSPEFLNTEWVEVKLAHALDDRAEYFETSRAGRGVPLHRKQRARVWQLLEEFERQLAHKRTMTHIQMIALAARVAKSDPGLLYRHAVVDEAQDLHPAHWRLIRALVPEGKDDIFLVGDAHQRIYGDRIVLSHYGINTVGRSRRLTVNYRTSEEILNWSLGVMKGADVDDMEGEGESLDGARSEFHGPDPDLLLAETHDQEDELLAEQLKTWLREGYDANDIAVFARRNDDAKELRDSLVNSDISAQVVGRKTSAKPGHVQVMTLHRAKGLEFPAVAIARLGANDHERFYLDSATGQEKTKAVPIERALLYVGATRSRERLALLATGRPSRLIAEVESA